MTGAVLLVAAFYSAAIAVAGALAWRWWSRTPGVVRAAATGWLGLAFAVPACLNFIDADAWPGWEPQPQTMLLIWWAFAVVVTGGGWWLWCASLRGAYVHSR